MTGANNAAWQDPTLAALLAKFSDPVDSLNPSHDKFAPPTAQTSETSPQRDSRFSIPSHHDEGDIVSADIAIPRLDKGKARDADSDSHPTCEPTPLDYEIMLQKLGCHDTQRAAKALLEQNQENAPETPRIVSEEARNRDADACAEWSRELLEMLRSRETKRGQETSSDLNRTSVNEESPNSVQCNHDSSYSSSLFEEAQENITSEEPQGPSWKQKERQRADATETEPLSSEPLNPGDPDWETSSGRPPQKQPIRFRDAVGRNFLFPWEKARTWTGMKKLIQSCLAHVEVIGPHVEAGHYDLSVNLPFPMDGANDVLPPGTTVPPAPSTSASDPSSSSSSNSSSADSTQQSSFVIMPELWEDTIEPGMLVVQHMWPFQAPNFVVQPPLHSPPPAPHQDMFGRGRGRGRGFGGTHGLFGGRGGGNVFGPPPMPPLPRPPMIVMSVRPRARGKTRKRPDT